VNGLDRAVVPALVFLGVGAGTLFPILRSKKKAGVAGLTFHKPRKDALERAVGGVVGLLGAIHLLWGISYGAVGPDFFGTRPVSACAFWIGAAMYLVGVGIVVRAQADMGKSWRIGIDQKETALVTGGLYMHVRNPIYLGVIIMGFGMLVAAPSGVTLAGAVLYWAFIQIQIRYEERHLLGLHGASYERFLADVGRLVPVLSRRLALGERAALGALGEAAMPGGAKLPAFSAESLRAVDALIDDGPRGTAVGIRVALWAVELACVLRHGRRFERLSASEREAALSKMLQGSTGAMRLALRALVGLVKSVHLERNPAAIGSRVYPPISPETPSWLRQVRDGEAVKNDEQLECDVVVVGTGAGGAPVAYELASRGHAVLLIEEGRHFGRHEFVGLASQAIRTMFRDQGMTLAMGNVVMPIWTGVTVGGSTTINSGTCYRTPERVFSEWRHDLGLEMFSTESMTPFFERVEKILGVEASPEEHLGGSGRALTRGAARLHAHGERIHRNAPGCDGQGRCMFGCPTGAKRSTDVSYVPMALERGALLYSRTRAESVLLENGRARGIVARTSGGARLTIRARATVLACGALMTPVFLQKNRLANSSGLVGRNLSVHPAAPVLALFDETIDMQRGIPQSWAVEEWAPEGLMMEESGNPPEVVGVALPLVGRRFVETFERYPNLAQFGFMIRDRSRGRVVPGGAGRPRIRYSVGEDDARLLQTGCERLSRLFLESGAKAVFPSVRGFEEVRTERELVELGRARLRPGDFQLSAVHPLGTARMGRDASSSVVDSSHECHDVKDLFVIDGAAVPAALGVNPQITIMAMATRAADLLHARL
jgi:choline dehydrogenase-like flavoprotein/protein-S-isoprenylcysteine O-methyltransferase Ste14